MLAVKIRVRHRRRDVRVFRPVYELLTVLGLLPCLIRRRPVNAPANKIEGHPWEARDSIGQIARVREDEPAREEVRPTISNLDHQPALLDHVIGKALPLEILLQRIRSYGREAYLMLLDRFESKPPLIFAEIDVFLRDLLAVKPHGD